MTIPQANGLYALNEISNRSPSASVTSAQSHLVGKGLEQTPGRFERARRGRVAVLRQQRRHQAGARGAADVERLGHRAELLADADRLRCGDAQRHRRAVRIERQDPRAGRGGAEHAGRAGDVPAAVVVIGVDRVPDAARDIDPEHDRIDDLPSAGTRVLGERERRRGDRTGRVDDRAQMRIVEIERVRRDAVQHRRARDVDALGASQDRRLRGGRELPDRSERRLDGRVA